MPFKVALYNEAETRLRQNAARIAGGSTLEVQPVYEWVYRPEMQFSVFELQSQKLQFTSTDGTTQLIDLTITGENITALLLDTDLSFVDLFYDLLDSDYDALTRFSGDRELIFAIGAEEASAIITPGGEVKFNNPDNLALLDSADLLTISLYQSNDAANVLWEYNLSGIYAYYKLPHVERLLIKTPGSSADNKEFRILGATRTRFEYYPVSDEEGIISYQWSFTPAGVFKEDFTHNAPVASNTNKPVVYWEPNEWKTDHNVTGILTITLNDGTVKNKTFKVTTRELKPVPGDEMEGSDVAMLEEMLWYLGFSPQYGYPGSEGTKIDKIAPDGSTVLAKELDIFSVGHVFAEKGDSRSLRAPGSHEKLVRRLQGRYLAISTGSQKIVSAGESASANGVLDTATLSQLEELYRDYWKAIETHSTVSVLTTNGIPNNWLTSALDEWALAYDDVQHSNTLDTGETVTRRDLLLSWLEHEGGSHWGKGYPQTSFRITEGGADEFASMGFNQILFQYSYGANKACVDGMNMFDPEENIQAFARWLVIDDVNARCDRPFYWLFSQNQYVQTYDNSNRPTDMSGGLLPRLRGFYKLSNNITWITATGSHTDDDYEKLSKAIMAYNSGSDNLSDGSWVELLLRLEPTQANKQINNDPLQAPYHGVNYSIDIKDDVQMRLRTYRLEWEVTANEAASSTTYNAGDRFCFDYSEQNWLNNISWQAVKNNILSGVNNPVTCQ